MKKRSREDFAREDAKQLNSELEVVRVKDEIGVKNVGIVLNEN